MNNKLAIPSYFPVACHTDNIGPGSTFVAIQGAQSDGVSFIPLALHKGATTIVLAREALVPQNISDAIKKHGAQLIFVENTRKALAQLSAEQLSYPARRLKIIAITGTKGKTTTTFIVEHLIRAAGYKTALLSSVKNTIIDSTFTTTLTTQQPDYLHVFFDLCVKAGVEYVVMETAAQAFSLYRTWGLEFDAGIFTNFDLEHSEFYQTIDDYFAAKCMLLEQLKGDAYMFLNADDQRCSTLKTNKMVRFGMQAKDLESKGIIKNDTVSGLYLDVTIGALHEQYHIPALMGTFNAYNILAGVTIARHFGIDTAIIRQALLSFKPVPGRLNKYRLANGAYCFIDNAHNPSSYKAVLQTVRPLTKDLIVVFGAGGNRDRIKRPIMGSLAAEFADLIIITSDNPRLEDAATIAQEILAGISPTKQQSSVICQLDREKAIRIAYSYSKKDSIIVILGKGHDEYQQVGTVKHYFSEKEIVKSLQ